MMGKQVQILLTTEDEERLLAAMAEKFPILVVDSIYPPDWDKETLTRSPDAATWVILDRRAAAIIAESAYQLRNREDEGDAPRKWCIRSKGSSCIDWNRDLYCSGVVPSKGRLYIDTQPDPIWADVSAETGDDVAKCYSLACRWLRKLCVNKKENHGPSRWTSLSRVDDEF